MQVIIPPLSKTRKMGSQSCRHSGQVKTTGMRQQGAGSTKLHYKGKTSHSSDWVLLTIPGLCCSSSMLLRIMQALMTLPRRQRGRNMAHPFNFQPKVNNGDITIPFWEHLPCFEEYRASLHRKHLSALAASCKSSGASFCKQSLFFQRQLCAAQLSTGTVSSERSTFLPRFFCPRRNFDLLFTMTMGISATDLQSQILSYDC